MRRLIAILLLIVLTPTPALGISAADLRAGNYNTTFYNESDDALTSSAGSCVTGGIPTTTNLDKSLIDAINKLKPQYVDAATQTGVSWQLLAAIHYRESGNDPNSDLQAGNPFGGPYAQASTDYKLYGYPKNLTESLVMAAKHLIASSSSGVVKKPINIPSPDANAIKDTLFSYNGRASVYAQQAASYGFDPNTQPFEGSPYVMNKYDAQRQAMGIITRDFGGLDGKDSRFGAFTIFSRLNGAAGGGDACTGVSSSDLVSIALKELGVTGPTATGYLKYSDGSQENWCADFLSWVFNKAGKSFTGGTSGGWRIPAAAGVRDWFKANGIWIDNTAANRASNPPKPGDVIHYNHGHVNMVISVTGTTAKIIGGNQGSNDFNASAVTSHSQDLTSPDVEGWGRLK